MEVTELVQLLSIERADKYRTWIETGLCLHNIDPSLLNCWIEFSRKSKKFKEGECEKMWSHIETKDDDMGMASLHRWAKSDNPKEYGKMMIRNLSHDILKSQCALDIAKVVYNMYKYQYKCTSVKYNTWYEFKGHRWFPIDSGLSLKRRIGNDVVNEYIRLITFYNHLACEQNDDLKYHYLEKSRNLTDVTYKLRDYHFKENIMKECQMMFYDPHFESQLDSNRDLIGFENGIYDLRTGEFRDGRPEDHVSLSTGNDYVEFKEDDELIVAIYYFISQIFPDPDVRDSLLILFSSFLEGRNPNEMFHIWIGDGDNGKSRLWELFELTFGKYVAKIPVTLFTDKDYEFIRLKGIRLVAVQEFEENHDFNIAPLMQLTGADRIPCRPLYRDPLDFKPQCKVIFFCNSQLPIPDDEGLKKRKNFIEFPSRFVDNPDPKNSYEFQKDINLNEKLPKWKEAFMYILLEHYKVYKNNFLKKSSNKKGVMGSQVPPKSKVYVN